MDHALLLRSLVPAVIACMGFITIPGPGLAANSGENYPNRPIRMIVGFAPGGGTDIVARIAGKGITEYLGQPVVVDNRPGGGGNIAGEIAAHSVPDGYTLITGGTGSHAINPSLFAKMSFDAVKDFSPVCLVAATPYLMVIHRSREGLTRQNQHGVRGKWQHGPPWRRAFQDDGRLAVHGHDAYPVQGDRESFSRSAQWLRSYDDWRCGCYFPIRESRKIAGNRHYLG